MNGAVSAYNTDINTTNWMGGDIGLRAVKDRQPAAAKFKFSDESVKVLDSAFRTCFQEMLAQPLNKDTLGAIEQLATHARSALSIVCTKSDVEEAEEAVRARAATSMTTAASYAIAPAPRSETFGAHVIRELMALAKTMHRDPTKMVQAAATARAEGMTELADQLEAEIAAQFTTAKPKPDAESPKVVKLTDRRKKKAAR